VTSILAAVACAVELGIEFGEACRGVAAVEPILSRNSVHRIEGGPVFILDAEKAPYATISTAIDFLRTAHAPRKTLVIGNISDYAGSGSAKYRRVAREALAAGARVVGVGNNAATIGKLRRDYPDGVLMTFATSREARDFLAGNAIPDELILLKSAASAHIERIMLNWAHQDERCWVENCGRKYCKVCPHLSRPQTASRLGQNSRGAAAKSA
jgi:UDP-N-acetylmuramoyl-tripeptide--D-alanyl-D-alanine ligase